MYIRKNVLFLLFFLWMLPFGIWGQTMSQYEEMVFTTMLKQQGEETVVTLIAPPAFRGETVQYTVNGIAGTTAFQEEEERVVASFRVALRYLELKGNPLSLYLEASHFHLIIPELYGEGEVRVLSDHELITHIGLLSSQGEWRNRTVVEALHQALSSQFLEGMRHRSNRSVLLVPLGEGAEEEESSVSAYSETFSSGETMVRLVAHRVRESVHPKILTGTFHGRAAQMPQVLSQQGVVYLVEKNINSGFYRWYAPDLSNVYVWGISQVISEKNTSVRDLFATLFSEINRYDSLYGNKCDYFPIAIDGKEREPILMKYWKSLRYAVDTAGELIPLYPPKMMLSDPLAALERMREGIDIPISLMGELPCEEATLMDPLFFRSMALFNEVSSKWHNAEKIAVWLSLLQEGFSSYPVESFDRIESLLFEEGTPESCEKALEKASFLCDSLILFSLRQMTSLIATQRKGKPVVVFNVGTHAASSVLAVPVDAVLHEATVSPGVKKPSATGEWRVFDDKERALPGQLVVREGKQYLYFTAHAVPGLGYKTFYVKRLDLPGEKYVFPKIMRDEQGVTIDNAFYTCRLSEKGMVSLLDKKLRKEWVKEGDSWGSPEVKSLSQDSLSFAGHLKASAWTLLESGRVFSSFERVTALPQGTLTTRCSLFHQLKKISWEVSYEPEEGGDPTLVEVPFVVNAQNPTVRYRVPLGFSRLSTDEVVEVSAMAPSMPGAAGVKSVNGMVLLNDGAGAQRPVTLRFELSSSFAGDKQLLIDGYTFSNPLVSLPAPEKNFGMIPDRLSFFALRNKELEIISLRKALYTDEVLMRILEVRGEEKYALCEPIFSFSGFAKGDVNGNPLHPISVAPATRLKLKTKITPWSVSSILLQR